MVIIEMLVTAEVYTTTGHELTDYQLTLMLAILFGVADFYSFVLMS